MIALPAIQMAQFGTIFYQAALSVYDVQKLVKFEVLSLGGAGASKRPVRRSRAGVNWEELEKRISASEGAFQRPLMQKKIDELVQYYRERYEHMDLAPIPGAVILVAERRLDFQPLSPRARVGHLELPEEEGLFHTLDGQHRLVALDAFARAEADRPAVGEALRELTVSAVIFDNLSAGHAVEMFVTINTKHTRLKKDIVVSLSGRRLYRDERLACAHDVIRSLNERQDSPLCGDIKILGVGAGRVSQAPLASEIENLIKNLEVSPAAARRFMEEARQFFLVYFKQIAQLFPRAWSGRKYSLRRGTALRAFIRVVPEVISLCRERGLDPLSARDLGQVLAPWAERIGDERFETEGAWRLKSLGGGSRTVELLVRELRDGLR